MQQPGFIGPPLEEKKRIKRGVVSLARRKDGPQTPGMPKSSRVRTPVIRVLGDPCSGCPREKEIRVHPVLPTTLKAIFCGIAPGGTEEIDGYPFAGESGGLLREAIRAAGLDDLIDVGFVNLARCRPENDVFESQAWQQAEDRCVSHLFNDLRNFPNTPVVILGTRATARFFADKDARVTSRRGLWYNATGVFNQGNIFVARHPSSVLRERDAERKKRLQKQFFEDIRRAADRILGREVFPAIEVITFTSPTEAREVAQEINSWDESRMIVFDIETFDAKQVPSRVTVATDPCHSDFRVRGVSVAVSGTRGYWIDFIGSNPEEARPILDLIFDSDCEKCAFVGYFDESGLIVPGWVSAVRNRSRDPWLGAIALDTYGMGHSMERLAVELLHEPQPKGGVDRSRIAEMSLEDVAKYGVSDACIEWRLDAIIQERLANKRYIWEWE